MIVVDTNVMVALLMGGVRGPYAQRLLQQDAGWSAPEIVMSELRNVLVGFVRRGDMTSDEARTLGDRAEAVLEDRISRVPGDAVIDTALECGLTAYDAEFVALARALGVGLVTMDAAILRGAPDIAVPLEAFAP
jgi:predicted nucleic acid-binding protein